jgi:hypothetical protein
VVDAAYRDAFVNGLTRVTIFPDNPACPVHETCKERSQPEDMIALQNVNMDLGSGLSSGTVSMRDEDLLNFPHLHCALL